MESAKGREVLKKKISLLKAGQAEVMSGGDVRKIKAHRRKLHHARHTLRKVIAKAAKVAKAKELAAAARAKAAPPDAPPEAAPEAEAPAS